jgi:hypothetical protein
MQELAVLNDVPKRFLEHDVIDWHSLHVGGVTQ